MRMWKWKFILNFWYWKNEHKYPLHIFASPEHIWSKLYHSVVGWKVERTVISGLDTVAYHLWRWEKTQSQISKNLKHIKDLKFFPVHRDLVVVLTVCSLLMTLWQLPRSYSSGNGDITVLKSKIQKELRKNTFLGISRGGRVAPNQIHKLCLLLVHK